MSRSRRGATPSLGLHVVHPVPDEHRGHLRAAAAQPQGEPDRLGVGQGGVLDVDAELVEQCSQLLQHVGDRRFEQLGLAGEVVVEGAEPDVGGVR